MSKLKRNMALVTKAAGALLGWSKTGFKVVDEATLERREKACLECPNLQYPVDILQHMVSSPKNAEKTGQRTGSKICALCGCNISKKIRLPSEACPSLSPTDPAITRWGEPVN